MGEGMVGEVRLFAGNFAPRNWALCAGQLLSIAQNTALFSILGTTYGGDGKVTFALPDLQGRAPVGVGQGPGLTARFEGESAGEPSVSLISTEMPIHSHGVNCFGTSGNLDTPTNNFWAASIGSRGGSSVDSLYAPTGNAIMSPLAIGVNGTGLPHNNMQPYLGLNFIICMYGIFPARN